MISRQEAIELLKKYNTSEDTSDWNHFLESEAVMRFLAKKLDEDEEYWAMLGLLHDVDWGLVKNNPKEHLTKTKEILSEAGFDEKFISIVISHGYGFDCADCLDKKRTERVEFALASAETVTGLVYAYARMRGNKISDMETQGLKKKFKDKAFAAGCRREIILECENFMPLDDFLSVAIEAMKSIKSEIGLS